MTMSLLLQTTQGLRGALASLPGADAPQSAPQGFQTALRQAFDTRMASSQAAFDEAPNADSLEAFRDALAALGVATDALDDASLSTLFSATEQALSVDTPSNGEHINVLERLLAEPNALAPADVSAVTPLAFANPADDTRLAEPAESVDDQEWVSGSLDEVKARLALVAAFADTPANAAQPEVVAPATLALNGPTPFNSAAGSTAPATPALSEAAAQVLNAVNTLRAEADPNARGTSPNNSDPRFAWSPQTPASLYVAATTSNAAPLEGDLASAPLAANANAMQSSVPGSSLGAEQAVPNTATGASAPTPATTSAAISTPVTSPAFPEKLGQQMIQLTQRGGEQQVKLELHPAELGPLSITLKVSEQGTQAQFFSAHAQVRQVVEQAIPQLREALAEQGISLGETSVGEQRQSNEEAFAKAKGASTQGGNASTDDLVDAKDEGLGTPVRLTVDGRVDLYA